MAVSREYHLMSDLDGMTVSELRELIDDYPDDAKIDVITRPVYGYGGWRQDQSEECFVFKWNT